MTCQNCGRDIKHGYDINSKGCYGSECVYKVANVDYDVARKKIFAINTGEKIAKKMLANKERYSWDEMKKEYGFETDEELYYHIIKTY